MIHHSTTLSQFSDFGIFPPHSLDCICSSQTLLTCPVPAPQSPAVCPQQGSRSAPELRSRTFKCSNWRRNLTTTSTCLPRRGLSWPAPWDWPRPRWKSGFRTAGTRRNESSRHQSAARTCTKWREWSSKTICPDHHFSPPSAELLSTDPTCGTTAGTGGQCYGETPMMNAAIKSHRPSLTSPDL